MSRAAAWESETYGLSSQRPLRIERSDVGVVPAFAASKTEAGQLNTAYVASIRSRSF